MRQISKNKAILLTLGVLFVLLATTSVNNPINNDKQIIESDQPDRTNLKSSGYWILSPFIIDDTGGGDYTWAQAAALPAGWCSGSGTWSDPYIIENVTIDGENSGSCIEIRNSNKFFIIENCTVYNSGDFPNAGIYLKNVENGRLINNNCSINWWGCGISLEYCNNITITENNAKFNMVGLFLNNSYNNSILDNNANFNGANGIFLDYSDNNIISGNNATISDEEIVIISNSDNNTISGNRFREISLNLCNNNNVSENILTTFGEFGILLMNSTNTIVSGNEMNKWSGVFVSGSLSELLSHNIDTTNLVNGNPLYYYTSEIGLGTNNFTNAGQVILVNCNDSLISNFNMSESLYGISLYHCYNNTISKCNYSFNVYSGIYLFECVNNQISGNTLIYNDEAGIWLDYSYKNNVSQNIIYNNFGSGLVLTYSQENLVLNNNVTNNIQGILLIGCINNTIYSNNFSLNNYTGIEIYKTNSSLIKNNTVNNNGGLLQGDGMGILLMNSSYNNITDNLIKNNSRYGISIGFEDEFSKFSGNFNYIIQNKIFYNNITGIFIYNSSTMNEVYFNNFTGNTIHAIDNGTVNLWIYNYWDDYFGIDIDDNGCGDFPYNITGTAGSQDFYPYWEDTDDIPIINMVGPNQFDYYGKISPLFFIIIADLYLNTTWYSLFNGTHWSSNVTFTEIGRTIDGWIFQGEINQTIWDTLGDGNLLIKFFANDSAGNIGSANVTVIKETINPIVIVNSPLNNSLFGTTAPNFNITAIDDISIIWFWYTLDGGATNYTFFFNGTINQTAWDACPNGTVTIRFYACDYTGNLGWQEVIIRKDIIAPIITVNKPESNEKIGAEAPEFNISIVEVNLDSMWYTIDGGITNITFWSLTGTIKQTLWDDLSEGLMTIRFYANDTVGNIGFDEVTVIKELHEEEDDSEEETLEAISGYNILFLIGAMGLISAILVKKRLK